MNTNIPFHATIRNQQPVHQVSIHDSLTGDFWLTFNFDEGTTVGRFRSNELASWVSAYPTENVVVSYFSYGDDIVLKQVAFEIIEAQ